MGSGFAGSLSVSYKEFSIGHKLKINIRYKKKRGKP